MSLGEVDYDALDEIASPQEQGALFGHQDLLEQLINRHNQSVLPHALAFIGPRGVGKATLAFHLARHIVGLKDIVWSPHIVHVKRRLRPNSDKFLTNISVDNIRAVKHSMAAKQAVGQWRVIIVDPVDDLNHNAANALLKALEEPMDRTLFLLLVHKAARLIPTLRSRCQLVSINPLTDDQIVAAITAIFGTAPDNNCIRFANGSVRQALLYTQFGGADISEALTHLVQAVEFDAQAALQLTEVVAGAGRELQMTQFEHCLFQMCTHSAKRYAHSHLTVANKWAQLLAEFQSGLAQVRAFNLDAKTVVMDTLRQMHALSK